MSQIWSGYVRASISLIGILTNTVNISVFLNGELKNTSYKLMMAKSVANLLYLLIAFINEIVAFCSNCVWRSYYLTVFYSFAFSICLAVMLAIFRILVEITLSIYILCLLINKPWTKKHTWIWILIGLAVLSFGIYSQKPLLFNIVQVVPGENLYKLVSTDLGLSDANDVLTVVQTFTRIFLSVIVLSTVNLINLYFYKRRYNDRVGNSSFDSAPHSLFGSTRRRNHQSGEHSKTNDMVHRCRQSEPSRPNSSRRRNVRNMSRMVIVSSLLYAIGELPYGIFFILNVLITKSPSLTMFSTISTIILYLVPSLDIFVYYFFNKLYRAVLNRYFWNVKKFFIRF